MRRNGFGRSAFPSGLGTTYHSLPSGFLRAAIKTTSLSLPINLYRTEVATTPETTTSGRQAVRPTSPRPLAFFFFGLDIEPGTIRKFSLSPWFSPKASSPWFSLQSRRPHSQSHQSPKVSLPSRSFSHNSHFPPKPTASLLAPANFVDVAWLQFALFTRPSSRRKAEASGS